MCFSTEASFAGAVLLTTIGVLNLRLTKSWHELFLAVIPFFFAIQQFAEGFIWMAAASDDLEWYLQVSDHAKYWFLTIGFAFWPIWIPLSLFFLEKMYWRKVTILVLLAVGVAFSLYMLHKLYFLWDTDTIAVNMSEGNIEYNMPLSETYFLGFTYLLTTLAPQFVSNYPYVWLLGCANTIALIVALAVYAYAFTSVWCFFAAWVSLGIYLILSATRRPIS